MNNINISDTIIRRIRAKRRGWVFTPKDFLDLASRGAVDNILSRLTKGGLIRRVDKGIYDFPKHHSQIGLLSPTTDAIAKAIVKKTGDILFPSGALAANLLGFSTQIPAKPVYLTNGISRIKKVNNKDIIIKHARIPLINNISFTSNLALQALSYIGKDNIDDHIIKICAKKLSKKDIDSLNKASPLVPAWMVNTICKIQDLRDLANG